MVKERMTKQMEELIKDIKWFLKNIDIDINDYNDDEMNEFCDSLMKKIINLLKKPKYSDLAINIDDIKIDNLKKQLRKKQIELDIAVGTKNLETKNIKIVV